MKRSNQSSSQSAQSQSNESAIYAPASTFGRYVIHNEIGRGGMSVVYRAEDFKLGRAVAIKMLNKEFLSNPASWGIMLREARHACTLNHPSVCTIFDVGEEDNQPYIAMELIEGDTLNKLVSPGGLGQSLVARIMDGLAGALAHAHERGIIHRDIKSANVIITSQGDIKLLDFGLAKCIHSYLRNHFISSERLSMNRGVVGTLPYIAPEILRGERAGVWTDIWSLGVLLYEMATGTFPFRGKTSFELAAAILLSAPEPPPKKLPEWIARVTGRCLDRNVARRYRCVRDILMDLPPTGVYGACEEMPVPLARTKVRRVGTPVRTRGTGLSQP